jgi:hypothetical protein
MLRTAALALALALAFGSGRLIVCHWICVEPAAQANEASCHDTGAADVDTIAGSIHACALDADSSDVAVTKTGAVASLVAPPLVSGRIVATAIGATSRGPVLPPGGAAIVHSPFVAVLRI